MLIGIVAAVVVFHCLFAIVVDIVVCVFVVVLVFVADGVCVYQVDNVFGVFFFIIDVRYW